MTATLTAPAFTPAHLAERAKHRRAVEAAIWGMPAVNYELMYREFVNKVDGGYNQILYWSKLLDWKNQTLTPNPDVVYLMPFLNTKEAGPMVLDVPPAGDDGLFNGSIMDLWQAAIEDVGPGGVDKGKGGKYLFLPPGYSKANVPDEYIACPSKTYQGYALVRSLLQSGSDADLAKAVAYAKRLKLYPLSQAANPPATKFIDASDVIIDSTIPYDERFFESLNRIVQAEPWLERDKVMIDMLKSIGIEREKPFKPDSDTRHVFSEALLEARAYLDGIYETSAPYYAGKQWFFPVGDELHDNIVSNFQTQDSFPVDARGSLYTYAFFSAKHAGEAQYYLLLTRDRDGHQLDGNSTYRTTVPADAPVTQYWSLTVYNRETHSFIRNAARMGRSSQSPELQTNADGSADIWFGPAAPKGKEGNWIPTDPSGHFELLARFYGPKKPLFDRSWQLNDVEKVA